MSRITIDGIRIIRYNPDLSTVYWTELSAYMLNKYGDGPHTNHVQVDAMLTDAFQYLLNKFKDSIRQETSLRFYQYIFWLHEQSIKLYKKTLEPQYVLRGIDENEFATYRRILKLIAEQGCDVDFVRGPALDNAEMARIDDKLQHLMYLATWMYMFADDIAFVKMLPSCRAVAFDEEDIMEISWQSHYGYAYEALFPRLRSSYAAATFDQQAVEELKDELEKGFNIQFNFASSIIFRIKEHHAPGNSTLQDIQPSVLPENLVNQFGISLQSAEQFYDGLTISRSNKLSIEEAILKPYSLKRYMFKPILIYSINGEERALIGFEKFLESLMVLGTNAIHWNVMPDEWNQIKSIREFGHRKTREHDRILEDQIEKIWVQQNFPFARNIKSFKQLAGNNIKIDNTPVGEIDFIVVNEGLRRVFVCDTKYNRARYEAVGFRNDYSNFMKDYEPQIERKRLWVEQNLRVVQEHMNIVWGLTLNLTRYAVEGAFLINTPTFYMFNGNYRAVSIDQVNEYFTTLRQFPVIEVRDRDGAVLQQINHPFFR